MWETLVKTFAMAKANGYCDTAVFDSLNWVREAANKNTTHMVFPVNERVYTFVAVFIKT
jgi:hypothetical protein